MKFTKITETLYIDLKEIKSLFIRYERTSDDYRIKVGCYGTEVTLEILDSYPKAVNKLDLWLDKLSKLQHNENMFSTVNSIIEEK